MPEPLRWSRVVVLNTRYLGILILTINRYNRGLLRPRSEQSVYGTALIHIPLGHPMMFDFPKHRPIEWPTMGKLLDQWEHELVDNCWYAIIDTVVPLRI